MSCVFENELSCLKEELIGEEEYFPKLGVEKAEKVEKCLSQLKVEPKHVPLK